MLEYIYPAPGEMLYKVIYTTCCRKTYSDFNISLWRELYGIIYGTQGGQLYPPGRDPRAARWKSSLP